MSKNTVVIRSNILHYHYTRHWKHSSALEFASSQALKSLTYFINEWLADTLLSNHTLTRSWDTRNTGALVCPHCEPNSCILGIEPRLLVADCNWMVLHTPNTANPLHRCFRRLSFTFYLNDCASYKYITALLRLHTIFVLQGGARRPRGRFPRSDRAVLPHTHQCWLFHLHM